MQTVVHRNPLTPFVVVVMTRKFRITAPARTILCRMANGDIHLVISHSIGEFEEFLRYFVFALDTNNKGADADDLAKAPIREITAALCLLYQFLYGRQ